MKICVKCKESKPLTEFYRNKNNADKLTGKCKQCYKKDVQSNYIENRAHYLEYERNRRQRPERKASKEAFRARYEAKHPEKLAAKIILNHAIETGKLKKEVCAVCGANRVEAHHEDYTKPLDVEWLCNMHHRQKHGTSVISP
jgi:hypothetical protein